MLKFFYLFVAVIFEVVGTTALKQSEQFTKLVPSIMVTLMYMGAFYFLSLTLKTMHVGILPIQYGLESRYRVNFSPGSLNI